MTPPVLSSKKGVALLVVLWVTVLLTTMASLFIATVRTEAESISNYKQETEAYYLARSGIHLAIQRLVQEESAARSPLKEADTERWIRDGRPYTLSLTKGLVTVRVMDEGGKIDLNHAQRSDFLRALSALGVKGVEKDSIADAILDWRDENNLHHLNGAEDDYYASLPIPYASKDGPFDTVDELLWVKGVTPKRFYGDSASTETPLLGMRDVFTVHNDSVRVNINTAPLGVLLSLPGVDEAAAQRLIHLRESGQIQNRGDFAAAGGKLTAAISKYLRFNSPGIYFIETTGWREESPIRHSITAAVQIKGKGPFRILYWKDQARVRGRAA